MRVHIENIKDLNPTADYKLVDTDVELFATYYYGYKDSTGRWYIVSQDGYAFRYARGDSDYDTNWTDRDSLTYNLYSAVF